MLLNKRVAQKIIDECVIDTHFGVLFLLCDLSLNRRAASHWLTFHSIEQASHIQSISFTVYAYDDVNGASAKVG